MRIKERQITYQSTPFVIPFMNGALALWHLFDSCDLDGMSVKGSEIVENLSSEKISPVSMLV